MEIFFLPVVGAESDVEKYLQNFSNQPDSRIISNVAWIEQRVRII